MLLRPSDTDTIGVVSRGILKIPFLEAFLCARVTGSRRLIASAGVKAIAGWGRKRSAEKARQLADALDLPYLALEDGFLRSVGPGDEAPLSIVLDREGIYYDATRPSQLETLIRNDLGAAQVERARALIAHWRNGRVSKYNHAREYAGELPERYVLVVDQTFGDASIGHGLGGPQSFQRMLEAALDENPGCSVLLKLHPDVLAGKKHGHFDVAKIRCNLRVEVFAGDVHPVRLIEHAEAVYVVTSQVGFEGLLWGKRVRTFGMPFYAGWGLTEDELPAPARRKRVPLETLVHAALVEYPRYIDPETGERCGVERLIQWLGLQRRMRERFPAHVCAVGFSWWKRSMVRACFQGSTVKFVRKAGHAPAAANVAIWGVGDGGVPDPWPSSGAGGARSHSLLRLEDGFLRSAGLGADLVAPLSWVVDRRGIYYDATRPSELEYLLQTHVFEAGLCARAGQLREAIVRHGVTKYNVGAGEWVRPALRGRVPSCRNGPERVVVPASGCGNSRLVHPDGHKAAPVRGMGDAQAQDGEGARRVILVPGQVENDASIRYGAAEVRTNLGLLEAVRKAHPDAYVVYKPHPDVQAGLRKRGAGEDQAARWCDEIVADVPMQVMLDAVDEVHVITSLTGFEALLRGRKVTCYGNPFYAGWGLTQDMAPLARRSRRLSLDELVAGALILYPTYVSRTTGRFTTPERVLEELLAWRAQNGAVMPLWRRGLRAILRVLKLNG